MNSRDISGHYFHTDGKRFVNTLPYPSDAQQIEIIKHRLRKNPYNCQHVVFYAHGGLVDYQGAAECVLKLKNGFLNAGIYPIHFIWESDLVSIIWEQIKKEHEKSTGAPYSARELFATEASDWTVEKICQLKTVSNIWTTMKKKARATTASNADLTGPFRECVALAQESNMHIHFIGHSAGSIFIGELLKQFPNNTTISTITLWAPACSSEFYRRNFKPRLQNRQINFMRQLNLTSEAETNDTISVGFLPITFYFKSLLELVSRGFETNSNGKPGDLLGLQRCFNSYQDKPSNHQINSPGASQTKTHGGFDDDPATIEDAIEFILGEL